ncbi:hypothetical protein [Candidatus Spongiihabitans sp.]|uniref:hypothetical protein n=1 Tax=Candidatus Spongiihabitans sp. TaxID=3101308 RepID=UPI003C70264F
MMRPMAETLGCAMSCCLHQGRSKTRSLALPRLGNFSRSQRICRTSIGGTCGCRRRLRAQDLAVRAAGSPLAWRTVSSDTGLCG